MSEPTSTTEKTVVVNPPSLHRLWTLTIISLALNGLILLFILIGCIIHHHDQRLLRLVERQGGPAFMAGSQGFGPGFHHVRREFRQQERGFGRGGQGEFRGNREMNDNDDESMVGMKHGMMMGGMPDEKQGPPDPARMTDKMLNHLSRDLTLTDDQKARIKPIIEAQVAQMQKDMETRRQAHQKAMEDTKAKIRPFLNTDQQKQLDALKPPPGDKGPQ